jgi:hypothetical protein
MLRVLLVFIGIFLLSRFGWAQAGLSPLARPVQPTLSDAPLTRVLAELSRQSGVPFSYSSTRIKGQRRCHLKPGASRPLGEVLHEVLAQHQLSYGLLNGQLVLWPATEVAPAGVAEVNGLGASRRPPGRNGLASVGMGSDGVVRPAIPGAGLASATAAAKATLRVSASSTPAGAAAPLALAGRAGSSSLAATPTGRPLTHSTSTVDSGKKTFAAAGTTKRNAIVPGSSGTARLSSRHATNSASGPLRAGGLSAGGAAAASRRPQDAGRAPQADAASPELLAPRQVVAQPDSGQARRTQLPAAQASVAAPSPFTPARGPELTRHRGQVSLLPPLSTNWLNNARSVNDFSLNVLVGYGGGVNYLEVGGLVNIVRDTVSGLQAAGLLNLNGTDVRGIQLAGLANVSGGSMLGVQGAGLVNVNRDDVRGLQIAGLLNVTGGAGRARKTGQPTRLRRWLGLPRLLATDPLAQLPAAPSHSQPGLLVQAAALANITGTDVRGLQTATIVNVARRVKGAQFGLINVAKQVSGAQIGLINIADSVEGASVGIINIVRHGYLHGEVWASESLPLNAVVKLGVRRYYTLLGVAAEPFGNRVQWASGFGVGTAGKAHGRITLSLDLIQWTLAGTSEDAMAESYDAHLFTQLRPALAWQIEREGHLQLVVSPTLNLAIAWSNDHQPTWDFGRDQWLLIDTAGSQSLTRLWPGLQVGLRF